jgi:hypothetical protein
MDDNVTNRKKPKRSTSETELTEMFNENYDVLNSTLMDSSMRSIHSDTMHSFEQNNSYTQELKSELMALNDKLNIADNEVENLNIEVNKLKLMLKDKDKQIELLKKLATNIPIIKNYKETPKKKKILNIGIRMSKRTPINHLRKSYLNLNLTPTRCDREMQTKMDSFPEFHLHRNSISSMYTQQKNAKSDITTAPISVLNEKKDIDEMIDREPTKRIIILADQQGRGLREKLQYLTGDEYKVYCFMKPGATLAEVLNSYKPELLNLTDKDIIVVLGGINDRNPELLQIRLNIWLHCVHHTKVIIGEVPYNSFLNVRT